MGKEKDIEKAVRYVKAKIVNLQEYEWRRQIDTGDQKGVVSRWQFTGFRRREHLEIAAQIP